MNITSVSRRIRRELAERSAASAIAAGRDRIRILRSVGTAASAGPHVLVASAGDGNIGDQAMFEAFLDGVDGDVLVVARRAADFRIPAEHAHRVRTSAFPELLYGTGAARRADLTRFGGILVVRPASRSSAPM